MKDTLRNEEIQGRTVFENPSKISFGIKNTEYFAKMTDDDYICTFEILDIVGKIPSKYVRKECLK